MSGSQPAGDGLVIIGLTLEERQVQRIGKNLAELTVEEIRCLRQDTPRNRCNIEVTHVDGRKQRYCLGPCNGSAIVYDVHLNRHGFRLDECKVIF